MFVFFWLLKGLYECRLLSLLVFSNLRVFDIVLVFCLNFVLLILRICWMLFLKNLDVYVWLVLVRFGILFF